MLITGINVLQATDRSDMVTDNMFGYKCVFSKIIQFYFIIIIFRAVLTFHN